MEISENKLNSNLLFAMAILGIATALVVIPRKAAARVEISSGFSFSQSTYAEGSYSWTRVWGASFGYNLTELTQIELSFQDVTDRTHIANYQDTTFYDRIYSVDWSQSFAGKNAGLQPYVKVGIGQLNREATGSYANGISPPEIVDSVMGVLGGGLKIYLTRNVGLRSEVTSYLTGGSIRTWKDNTKLTLGFSLYL
ncbi:MAG: hypothetical protein A2070_15045 [Bdellovibrionales bacterium GWC1_52_8]|nr:MAG: hypothetical protein A2Z97_03680 [Bdellovibrionales bacterium GWB1_52_6]OFZ02954.1 MAG: hypothetical protein A2X97_05110 [Bdellovibrionales bacterium GWA1_52_35]OFZ33708.1 MAG: hypothetical protein A2070_15045 [Bdellovibrionales bacterium GWC1_52_8]